MKIVLYTGSNPITGSSGEAYFDDIDLDATPVPPPAPAAPTGLKAQGAAPTYKRLTWQDNSNNETGFEIQRKQANGSWQTMHTTAANTTSWTESGLSSGTLYTYRVRAIATNVGGTSQSAWTNESTAPTFANAPEIDDFEPASVVNWVPFASDGSSSTVTLIPGHVGDGAMHVDYAIDDDTNTEWGGAGLTYGWAVSQDWTGYNSIDFDIEGGGTGRTLYLEVFDNMNPSTHAVEKFVYSFADDFTGWQHKTVSFSDFGRKSVQDAGAPNDGFGRDEVWGVAFLSWSDAQEFGEGAFSLDEIFLTSNGGSDNFSLTAAAASSEEIDLSWSPVAGATEYQVELSYDGSDFGEYPVTAYDAGYNGQAAPPTQTALQRLDPETRIFARISAYNGPTLLGTSNIADATTPIMAPGTPAFVEAVIDGTDVTVSWTAADDWEDRFILERQTNGGSWVQVAQPVAGSASFADSVPSPDDTYAYRIKAESSRGASGYSDAATAAPAGEGQAEAGAIPTRNILVGFYGADPGEADSQGNVVFLQQYIYDTAANQYGYTRLSDRPYRDFQGSEAFRDLLDAIDVDDDRKVETAEIDAVTVRVVGWSLGAVEAVNFSRWLTDTFFLAGRTTFKLQKAVPIQSMVLLDPVHDGAAPLTLRFPHGEVKSNVSLLTTYYQRRGGTSTIDYYASPTAAAGTQLGSDSYRGSDEYTADILGVSLRGRPVKVAAGVTDGQFRIDAPPLNTVDPDYSNWQKIHQYKSFGGADLWGELYGREVNHTTLVWYVQDEAVQWLG